MALDTQGNYGYNKIKGQKFTDNTKLAKIVWAKKVLDSLAERDFCGNVQFNFHQGTITSKEIRDIEKAPF
jgi:hypothetical protein